MLDSGQRKEIDEIITKYELEPSLEKEIYIEGSTDKALVDWFLKKSNITNISVLEISTVNVEKEKVLSMGLDDNNRNRLVCLSHLVEVGIICIIDSDFDFLETPPYQNNNLISTDYSSMEIYGFNKEILEKILLGYPAKKPKDFQVFKTMIGTILLEIFLIRYTKSKIKKELKHIHKINKDLKIKSNNIIFDRDNYLKKYVKNNKQLIEKFNNFISSKKENLPNEIRKIIHGHDFIYLLGYYLGITDEKPRETFQKSFYSALEYDMLKEENMFKTLVSKLSSHSN